MDNAFERREKDRRESSQSKSKLDFDPHSVFGDGLSRYLDTLSVSFRSDSNVKFHFYLSVESEMEYLVKVLRPADLSRCTM